jgi:hypothetical protein
MDTHGLKTYDENNNELTFEDSDGSHGLEPTMKITMS